MSALPETDGNLVPASINLFGRFPTFSKTKVD
jgi:hypothetical protein